ncbi:hypothetical protein POPTR_005G065026v4 [Populus trichocarpa]|jgi:hypothetical protein|uniref:Uncharacterized protein n=1 Tax=Populus trichocarpa TaxID=3694 RepID=A0ACC0SYA8_POPTR|nr:hypothetical protein POPTR_005G065026v4 [Populus trichocarpa]
MQIKDFIPSHEDSTNQTNFNRTFWIFPNSLYTSILFAFGKLRKENRKLGASSMALGSTKQGLVQKEGSSRKLLPPIRGKIKRQILACFMKKMEVMRQKTILFLLCCSGETS